MKKRVFDKIKKKANRRRKYFISKYPFVDSHDEHGTIICHPDMVDMIKKELKREEL